MEDKQNAPTTIDEYIARCPEDVQPLLNQIRAVIRAAAPQAAEKISYGMPTFYQNGNLVHFAAFKSHIGFFPTAEGIEAFQNELSEYKTSKGTIQFPLGQDIPYDLITRIVQHRLQENTKKAGGKKK